MKNAANIGGKELEALAWLEREMNSGRIPFVLTSNGRTETFESVLEQLGLGPVGPRRNLC